MGGRGRPVWKNRKIFPLPAKELDSETGYYYFGARYYDPKVSMWISTDPAIGKYLPTTAKQIFYPEDKFDFRSMPGIGGAYNSVNLNVYHYAGQNPIKLTDPDGTRIKFLRSIPGVVKFTRWLTSTKTGNKILNYTTRPIGRFISKADSGAKKFVRKTIRKIEGYLKKEGHHSDPKFLGGEKNQPLTNLSRNMHKKLHNALNKFLDKIKNSRGNSMRPKKGNSGQRIRSNFSRKQRLDAMAEFYKTEGAQFKKAAQDFFKQHKDLQ